MLKGGETRSDLGLACNSPSLRSHDVMLNLNALSMHPDPTGGTNNYISRRIYETCLNLRCQLSICAESLWLSGRPCPPNWTKMTFLESALVRTLTIHSGS
jgi:hypothetical protein